MFSIRDWRTISTNTMKANITKNIATVLVVDNAIEIHPCEGPLLELNTYTPFFSIKDIILCVEKLLIKCNYVFLT